MQSPTQSEITWQELLRRARETDAAGALRPFVDSDASLAEVRRVALMVATRCPADENHPHCPFCLLSKLSAGTVHHLLETMGETDLRELFVMELLCRKLAQRATSDKADPVQ